MNKTPVSYEPFLLKMTLTYLLLDANSWIFSLTDIQTLYEENPDVVFVISWSVLQRLDKLRKRSDNSVSLKAAEASKFIADERTSRRFIFESIRQSNEHSKKLRLFASADRILGTALHYQERGHMVIVITQDDLLLTKCFANDLHSRSTVRNLLM